MTNIEKDIEKATRDLNSIEEQREALISRARQLSKQREAAAFAAHTGDAKAKEKLREINLDDIGLASNIASVEAALVVARANLAAAQAAEASAADRAKAEQIAVLNAQLKEQLHDAEDAFADGISSVLTAKELLSQLHALGVTSPTDPMFRINSIIAIKTVLQLLPQNYISDFEFQRLAPSQKRQFKSLADAWCSQITNQIGDKHKEVA
jgi:Mg2+ and Co2+ transporter CorA